MMMPKQEPKKEGEQQKEETGKDRPNMCPGISEVTGQSEKEKGEERNVVPTIVTAAQVKI